VLQRWAKDRGYPEDPTALDRARLAMQMASTSVAADDTIEGLAEIVKPVMKALDARMEMAREAVERKAFDRCTSSIREEFKIKRIRAPKTKTPLSDIDREERKALDAVAITFTDDELLELKTETDKIAKERHERQKEFLALFFRIFSVHGKGSTSMKAMCEYRDEWIKNQPNNSLRIPTKPFFNNVTFFGQEMINQIVALESLIKVHNCHQHILTMLLAALHLYKSCKMHLNIMMLSGPGTGKSFAIEVLDQVLIPGTSTIQSGASAKADTADDSSEVDDQAIMCEEGLASVLGAKDGRNAATSVSNDGSSIMRNKLTAQMLIYDRLEPDPNRPGKYIKVRSKIRLNQAYFIALNLFKWQLHSATVDRFFVMNFNTNQSRSDLTQLDKIAAESTYRQVLQKAMFITKWRRNQAIVAQLFSLERCFIIKPVNMSIVRSFVRTVMQVGRDKFRLTNTENARHLTRLYILIEVLTLFNVVNMFYDSELGQKREEKLRKEEIETQEKGKACIREGWQGRSCRGKEEDRS
jgi:hypothetical protein